MALGRGNFAKLRVGGGVGVLGFPGLEVHLRLKERSCGNGLEERKLVGEALDCASMPFRPCQDSGLGVAL